MKLFVYEYVTGGGTWQTSGSIEPVGSLLAEGKGMVEAVVADFDAAGVEVSSMIDARLRDLVSLKGCVELVASAEEEAAIFRRLVERSDATLVIAPEIGGALLDRCRRVEESGGRLISPGTRFVEIAADKQATAERLAARGVPVPRGMRLPPALEEIPDDLFPAVVKPSDGAGSWQVMRFDRRQQLAPMANQLATRSWRIERLAAGLPASVAVLCGPRGNVPLEPCEQILERGSFAYLGGRLPLAQPLAQRARSLALAAIEVLPPTTGYVGIDLILGASGDGSEDYVIEVNPRLTTSYVGLRRACRQNLAAAMLAIAAGEEAALSFALEPLEFRADGSIGPFDRTAL